MTKIILATILFLAACSPTSVEQCQHETERLMQQLLVELAGVECRADALEREVALRKIFTETARLMLIVEGLEGAEPRVLGLNERLRAELVRVYDIPGVREVIEGAQEEALLLLADLNRAESRSRSFSSVA